jgi:signal transduction histidine kinase
MVHIGESARAPLRAQVVRVGGLAFVVVFARVKISMRPKPGRSYSGEKGLVLMRACACASRSLWKRAVTPNCCGALENVPRNAIRHAPVGTDVEVQLERRASLATISVRDYGPGVAPELLDAIFQPFFRGDAARANASGGVGLGLAIAQRAISLHNGRIWAANAHPGLAVHIELPVPEKIPQGPDRVPPSPAALT